MESVTFLFVETTAVGEAVTSPLGVLPHDGLTHVPSQQVSLADI